MAGGNAGYADDNGAHMYNEATGEGEPLVLLHGGFGGVHVFGAQIAAFAERHRVALRAHDEGAASHLAAPSVVGPSRRDID